MKKLKQYAALKGFKLCNEKDYTGLYKALKEDGTVVKSFTIKGLKNMIDKNSL